MSADIKARMAAASERAQAAAKAANAPEPTGLTDEARAALALGIATPGKREDAYRQTERKAYAATREPKITAARERDHATHAPRQQPTFIVDLTHRDHMVRYFETGRDAGSTDAYWCATCRNPEYQCVCPCECGCACKLKTECECTCVSTHRRQCTRENKTKCQCQTVACTCKCRCGRTQKHAMEREARKKVTRWDPDKGAMVPVIIDGTEVMQTHGYSALRSRKFGTAKKAGTRWQRPTEDAAIGKGHPADWEGDDYVTLPLTTSELAAFTVAHQFVKNRTPKYADKGRQAILDKMLTSARKGEVHAVRMFTAGDLRKLTKRLPVRLTRGELASVLGAYVK